MRKKVGITAREGTLDLLIDLTTAVGTGLVLYAGAHRVQANAVTVGELLIVLNYLARLYSPLKTVTRRVTGLQRAYESLQRSFEILDEVPEVEERPDARPLRRGEGHVELRDVSFSYDGVHLVLEDVSLDVPAGTRVGIAGRTGAGKSTLVSLLLRFYDVDRGEVLLDGVDVRDYRLADLRSQFAMVLQDPVLFATSIGENIAYGRPGASFDAVQDAAAAAGVGPFIEQLPNGYDTLVGERGQRLSGGERQRISLARAFLKDAPILLLDEPTSSVDVQTEAAIMESMERLMAGRTTFMVAHRLSTLDVCDVVVQVGEQRVQVGVVMRLPDVAGVMDAPSDLDRAIAAWRGSGGAPVRRGSCIALKESSKSRAYRLVLDDRAGTAIVAKRRVPAALETDLAVYGVLADQIGVRVPALHAVVDDPPHRWAFMEDVSGVSVRPRTARAPRGAR